MNMENAKKYAVYLLAKRDYTEKEIKDKLITKGYDAYVAQAVADKMKSYGYLSDENYARRYFHFLSETKKYGMIRIKAALAAKGISRETIDLVLEENPEDGIEKLMPLMEKKLKPGSDIKEINKIKRHFFNKGYSASIIDECIRTLRDCFE